MGSKKRISYDTILKATDGSLDAMAEVLQYFDRYIEAHSYQPYIEGFPYSGVGMNVDIKAQIQERLMEQIMRDFDPTQLPEGEILEL